MKTIIKSAFVTGIVLSVSYGAFAQDARYNPSNNSKKEAIMETLKTTERNKEIVRNLYENILNNKKLEQVSRIISDDYIGIRGEKGPAGFTEVVNAVITAVPDIKWNIEDLIAEGDKVVIKWTWKGTNTASFSGFKPSNTQITNSAIAIYQLKDGKIVHAWMQTDRLGFLQQIGVVSKDIVPAAPVQKVGN